MLHIVSYVQTCVNVYIICYVKLILVIIIIFISVDNMCVLLCLYYSVL